MTLVLGYHHPLAIVKRYGTLDHVSNGRVILGVGVGSLKEEFDLLGAPFDDRGARGDDALRALERRCPITNRSTTGSSTRRWAHRRSVCATASYADVDWRPHQTLVAPGGILANGWCPYYVSIDTAAEWLKIFDVPADPRW